MLAKLAFKNVGKSLRDYAIYFITLAFGVCVFYMFNSIYAQQEIMSVTETTNQAMIALGKVLGYISVFVAVILGFLIVYANNFFIRRRKKELGIYMILGMDKSKMSAILVLETSLMALLALGVGLLCGVFGSQLMSVFTAKIFEANMTEFKFVFAPTAALKSIIYFGIIFIMVIMFNTFVISKFKMINLLYGGRKNESIKIESTWLSVTLFICSLLSLASAYYLLLTNGIININSSFLTAIVLGTTGTFLFFLSLAGIMTRFFKANKTLYFNNLNMFVLRQLSSKINTNFVSMSVVCIVLLLTIGIFSSGYSMQKVASADLKEPAPYSISLFNYSNMNAVKSTGIYAKLPREIQNSAEITEWSEYSIYKATTKPGSLVEVDYGDLKPINENILQFMAISDYNKLLKLQGKEVIDLEKNHYFVYYGLDSIEKIALQFPSKNIALELGQNRLLPMKEVQSAAISNTIETLIFIVDDGLVEDMTPAGRVLNIKCIDTEAELLLTESIRNYQKSTNQEERGFDYLSTREDIYRSSISTKALVAYLAIYLGIVFMIICAAILAIQQLSEAADNKSRYDLLKKLGADKQMLNKALFTQIAAYFFFPLVLAVIHSIIGLTAVNKVIRLLGNMDIAGSIAATAIFIVVVYGTYFVITYVGSRNIINRG